MTIKVIKLLGRLNVFIKLKGIAKAVQMVAIAGLNNIRVSN